MMKILIAEDELLERKAMKKFIQDNFKDMEVVGEAANGRIAIELAEELKPDVIFMDIKMPGINGLEAIEKIHATKPKIKFILVSAYDTFEYAKQAMKFGIKDYILKPGKTDEIVKALLRVRKEINEAENIVEEKRQSTQLLKESFIRKVMQYPIGEDSDELMTQILPTAQSSYYLAISSRNKLETERVRNVLEKHVDDLFIVCEVKGMVIALIMLTKEIKKADQLILARKLSLDLDEHIFIGVGLLCTSINHLPTSYREAYAACFHLKTWRNSNYGFLNEKEEACDHEDIITKIVEKVEQGQRDEALGHFKKHHDHLDMIAKETLYMSIQTVLKRCHITVAIQSLSTIQTNEDWETYINVCCMKINEHYQSEQSMTKAREYIENYYSQGITLEDVSNSVNLSPNYFSNLFKEEYDETFVELLTRVRMEKAKELVEKNTYSLKEISFMIGYKDPNYFSRVFKRYYDISPKHFQKGLFKKI